MSQDCFNVTGNVLEFGPWTVGELRSDIPATVRDRIESWLIAMDAECKYTDEERDEAEEKGYNEARVDYLDEIKELKRQIAELKTLVHEMDMQMREKLT